MKITDQLNVLLNILLNILLYYYQIKLVN